MPVSDFKDLQCWQLANSIRAEAIAICDKRPAAGDFRFCDSFRDAAASVCRNIAEGFTRYESGEIVQFFRYALASLAEVQDHLVECRARSLIEPAEFDRLIDRCQHAKATMLNFMKPHIARKTRHRHRTGRTGPRRT